MFLQWDEAVCVGGVKLRRDVAGQYGAGTNVGVVI